MSSPIQNTNSNHKSKEDNLKQEIYSSSDCSGSEENIYGELTSNGLHRIRLKEPKDLLQCPTPGCDGLGHISGNYATHRSLSGCPHADRAMVAALHQELKCPTPGCNGSGHITGNYTSHRSLSGCPRASRKRILASMNGNSNKREGTESIHSNQSETDSCLKADNNNDNYNFVKLNKIEFYSNSAALGSADSNDSTDSKNKTKLSNQNNVMCPTIGCDGKGHITGAFLRHRSASGCPRLNASNLCQELNNHNSTIKKNYPMYSDDEEGPESMFIREKLLKDQPAPKDINELREKSKELESELLKLKTEFNETSEIYELLKDENFNIHKETVELRLYHETLQIDLISLIDEVELPEMNEKLSIYNFDSYIEKLEKFFQELTNEELKNLSEKKKSTLNILKSAFQDYKIPEFNKS